MLDEYIHRNDKNIAYRVIDDEAVIVNVNKSTFHTLNDLATFIWNSIDGKTTTKDIIRNVINEFQVNEAVAEKDTLEFINELKEKNLIIISPNPL